MKTIKRTIEDLTYSEITKITKKLEETSEAYAHEESEKHNYEIFRVFQEFNIDTSDTSGMVIEDAVDTLTDRYFVHANNLKEKEHGYRVIGYAHGVGGGYICDIDTSADGVVLKESYLEHDVICSYPPDSKLRLWMEDEEVRVKLVSDET